MLKNILSMAGMDEAAIASLKADASNTAERLKHAEAVLTTVAAQVAEMHAAFFQMVPRPQPIQEAEIIENPDVIELNTPDTAFKVADPVINH
jgi:hypothetical protein